jgi:hypothetical protein
MSTFETYTAARDHQAKLQSKLDEARKEYNRQLREVKRDPNYANKEEKQKEYCAPALEKVRQLIEAVEEARVATWAAADAVEDKTLMANEYI